MLRSDPLLLSCETRPRRVQSVLSQALQGAVHAAALYCAAVRKLRWPHLHDQLERLCHQEHAWHCATAAAAVWPACKLPETA
jgi:hypothetical protein